MADELTLTVDGLVYSGWEKVRVTTGIEYGASEFEIEVSERWAQQPQPWQIKPFQSAVIAIDGTPILTGYVERYSPSYSGKSHSVRVGGRSKTCDVVDCMPDVSSGFNEQTLDKVAQAAAAPFGVNVIKQCDVGDPFIIAVLEKTETAHGFIERLARMRSVLVTDDESGNLVLTQAGLGGSASTDLIERGNILAASANLNVAGRYQIYVVLSQLPEALSPDGDVVHDVIGTFTDRGCPRPRRYAEHAEEASDFPTATARAKWRRLHNFGKATEATISLQGWHQSPGGDLWKKNQLVWVDSPFLEVQRQLLIGTVTFVKDDDGGTRTELTVAPPEAFTPGPLFVRDGSSNAIWLDK